MAAVSVSFNGTRLNDSDSNTGWGNFNIGGGSPASEPANAYQRSTGSASTVGAVGKKINSTTARQGVDYVGTSVDFTAAANRLWYCKVYVADGFNVNSTWGVEVAMGSANTSNSHRYNIAGSGANRSVYSSYPPQGGYIITCIDPTIDSWAETADDGGAFDQTSVVWYAVGAQFATGEAKSENVAMDAIDYGTGLTLVGGDGGDTDGKYTDFVDFDQNDIDKRYGAAIGNGDAVIFRGIATLGSATATEFTDTTSVVTFPDGYHSAGLFGVNADIQNASTLITDGALLISNGSTSIEDTRADYTVSGTSGTFSASHQIRNFRNITYTSVCDVENADIECQLLTQNSANISNTTIRTNSLSGVACLQDPTLGTTTDLNNVDFIQSGVGHAIELATTNGDFTLTNITFTGYGSDTANDAAIYVSATTGTTTINYTGAAPTVRSAGAAIELVGNPVTLSINVKNSSGANIQNSRVLVETAASATGGEPFEESVSISQNAGTATVSHTGHGMTTGDVMVIRGAQPDGYNKAAIITVTGVDNYTYSVNSALSSPATGTPVASFAPISGLTDANGDISATRTWNANQSLKGVARKGNTSSPFLKPAEFTQSISSSNGLAVNLVQQPDE